MSRITRTSQPRNIISNLTSIDVVIRSKVFGISDKSIKEAVISQTWMQILAQAEIPFSEDFYILTTTKRKRLNIHKPISEFFHTFKKSRSTYIVYIHNKPGQNRIRNGRRLSAIANGTGEIPCGSNGNNTEEIESDAQLPSDSSTTPFSIQFAPPHTYIENGDANLMDDEDNTQIGNVVRDGEEDIRPQVLRWMNEHCSNRDMEYLTLKMLRIRQELRGLENSLQLARLLPFTGAFLKEAFLTQRQ